LLPHLKKRPGKTSYLKNPICCGGGRNAGGRASSVKKLLGVRAHRKGWESQIKHNKKQTALGVFDKQEQAARAFDIAKLWHALHGGCSSEKELSRLKLNSPCDTYDEEALKGFATVQEVVEAAVEGRRLQPGGGPAPASGFRGVKADGKGWRSRIWENNKETNLSVFDKPEQAARAFDIARLWLALRGGASEEELNLLDLKSPRDTYKDEEDALKGFATVQEAVEACVEGRRLKPEPASGYRGVDAHGKGWASRIWHNNEWTYLATVDTPEQAARAFDIAVLWLALRGGASEEELNLNSPRATYEDDEEALKGFTTVQEAVEACAVDGRRLRPESASGYRGVTAIGEGWQSRMKHNDKETYLGLFGTPEPAARAYDLAVLWHAHHHQSRHGGFTLNFEPDVYDDEVGLYKLNPIDP
jgi:hypothetical protein